MTQSLSALFRLQSRLAAVLAFLPLALSAQTVQVRFLDSATGCALVPESVTTRPRQPGAVESRLSPWQIGQGGRASLSLEPGRHTLLAISPNHKPMVGDVEVGEATGNILEFLLDPVEEPPELRPDYIASLQRDDAMLIQGFVVAEESRAPLTGVRVHSEPSGAATSTDERGFFQFYVPLQSQAEAAVPAKLIFAKAGYRTQERQYVELWARGDWTYRVRLATGGGVQLVDERTTRRRPQADEAALGITQPQPATAATLATDELLKPNDVITPQVTAATNSTVRVPRNIRVQLSDSTIQYVSMLYYVRCVLPSEWIPSWGATVGGTNSLNAGAVAARCYAIAKLNAVSGTSTYDICATTSCQVYNPANINSRTDAAATFTDNWVVLSGSAIPSTEYSAQNNSIGFSCGDGWTQPTGGCIFDPVCLGKARSGHGRGMCQWGTYYWSIGTAGYPRRDWQWIVQHYYPTYTLLKGAPLLIGDDVKATESININLCADGGITNGLNCPLLATLPGNTTGTIVDGPQQITADGKGFTWYKVQWNDANQTLGWGKENFIERVFSVPSAPASLSATAAATNRINLTWSDTAGGVAAGFRIERAIAATGPWLQINTVAAGIISYSDLNLSPGSTWYYRVRAYNSGGNSSYSAVASAITPNTPPVLAAIANKTITETTTLTLTNSATASDFVQLITDFEAFTTDTTNGLPLLRNPRYSGSTSANLDTTPDLAVVTDVYTTTGHGTGRVLRINYNCTNASNPWLRLTTASAPNWPNPVIDLTRKLRFDLYTDKAVKVAVGCRETSTAAGTPIGSNGGTAGNIEWTGVTNISGTAPMPTRTVAAGAWATLTFNLSSEPITSFSGGNGVLSTASGLGVLEHVAIVPAAGTGTNNLYFDNFAVLTPRALTFSLGANAPTNATLNPASGVFTWTPTEAQAPSTNSISVIVTDNSVPPVKATNTFTVVVLESNSPPVLAAIPDRTIHAGTTLTFTNSATDSDLPPNSLTYSLDPPAPANASVGLLTGIFQWPTTDTDAGTTNPITVRVSDNANPPMTDAKIFTVTVFARPTIRSVTFSNSTAMLSWEAIPGTTYRVQFKNDLDDAEWTNLPPDVTASTSVASLTDSPGVAQRFYRILVLN
jgi:peptidoglycan hydrolase-like amidase